MLIECVPNVSEGRSIEVVDDLAAIVSAAPGVRLLDRTSDPSHNRSVLTFAGDPAAVGAAAYALADGAVRRIDLRRHRGEHPRIGALDVVPFVPLEGTPMAECVRVARDTAARIGAELSVPVYLYEDAALRADRRNLEIIRRGGLEGLASRMDRPEWAPDYGPGRLHPSAGAVVVGARQILIAYNINLATGRLDVAKSIARSVRTSGGGLPFVKALGLTIGHRDGGIVQVSMNLTNHLRTSLADVFARVKDEAARYGVEILDSEIVGLAPADAFRGTTPDALHLKGFTSDRILEERLRMS